jgi:carbon monoxide dehydrogenase subunit G
LQLEYSHLLAYPRERVWKLLLDPEVLSRLLPGVEKFEVTGPDKYGVVVKLGVPSVKGTYTGSVEIVDKNKPSSYRLRGEGKGMPGWARGEAHMTLIDEAGKTRIVANAKAQVGGTIAGVGQRMMEGVAKAMAREFFESVDRELQGQKQQATTVRFGFRVILVMLHNFFEWLFRRRTPQNPQS